MTGALVLLPPVDGVAVLRLVNPARRNAISTAMWQELGARARALGEDAAVRALVIEGEGAVFSAGADISGFAAARSGVDDAKGYDDLVEETCRLVEAIPQPTVAAIEGYCFGAGASLAASCDLRVAGAGAVFCVPAARLGLGYDVRGIARFRRVFGPAGTAALLLTADRMGTREAQMLGAVYRVSADGEAGAEARALAGRMAENAPLTLRAAKTALRALALDDSGIARKARNLAAAADASADYAEGRAAFAEKRKPRFLGH